MEIHKDFIILYSWRITMSYLQKTLLNSSNNPGAALVVACDKPGEMTFLHISDGKSNITFDQKNLGRAEFREVLCAIEHEVQELLRIIELG